MESPGEKSVHSDDALSANEEMSKQQKRSRFQFNLTSLLLAVNGVALIIAARIHTEHYFGMVILLALLFASAAVFVTKVLRVPNDGTMRREFIQKKNPVKRSKQGYNKS